MKQIYLRTPIGGRFTRGFIPRCIPRCILALVLGVATNSAFAMPINQHGHAHRHTHSAATANISHVFIIVLENEGFDKTFGSHSEAPYLSKNLTQQGVLLAQYFGTSHASLGNYTAMISGQGATPQIRDDCEVFEDFVTTGPSQDGQAVGHGCVYPASTKTLVDQLEAKGLTWHGYMEDMGNNPSREATTCAHPTISTKDLTQGAEKPSPSVPNGDQYAARHNPFNYFHSIIDSPTCQTNVVNLKLLPQALKSVKTTPNLVFITPNLCNDGHDEPCVDGAPGGLVSADLFLKKWVPLIQASAAYRNGLLIIMFDEGDSTATSTADGTVTTYTGKTCCSEQPGPNLGLFPQSEKFGRDTYNFQDFGGDRTGAVLLSPLIKSGTVSNTPFNHYSLLKTLEDIFHTDGHLGFAAQPGLVGFFGCVRSDIATVGGKRLLIGCATR